MLNTKILDLVKDKTIKLSDLLQSDYQVGGNIFSFSSASSSMPSYLDYPFLNSYGDYIKFSFGFAFRDNFYSQYLSSNVFYPGISGLNYSSYEAISDNASSQTSEITIPNSIPNSYEIFVDSANSVANVFYQNLSLFYHPDLIMNDISVLAFKEYSLYDYFSSAISIPIGIKFKSIELNREYRINTCDAFMLEFMFDISGNNIMTEYESNGSFFSNYSFLYVNIGNFYQIYKANQDNPENIILVPAFSNLNGYIIFHSEIVTLNTDDPENEEETIEAINFIKNNEIIYVPNERVVYKNPNNQNEIKLITDLNPGVRFNIHEVNERTKCGLFKISNSSQKLLEIIDCSNENIIRKIQKAIDSDFVYFTEDFHKFKNKVELSGTGSGSNVHIKKEFYHAAYKRLKIDINDIYVKQIDFLNLYPSLIICSNEQSEIGLKQKAEGIIRYTCIKFIDYENNVNSPIER